MGQDPETKADRVQREFEARQRQEQAERQAKERQVRAERAAKNRAELARSVDATFDEALDTALSRADIVEPLNISPLDPSALRRLLAEDRKVIFQRIAILQQQWEEAWLQSKEQAGLTEFERAGHGWIYGFGGAVTIISVLAFLGSLLLLLVGYVIGAVIPAVRGLQGPGRLTLFSSLAGFVAGMMLFALDALIRRRHDRRIRRRKIEAAAQSEVVQRRAWQDSLLQSVVAQATTRINDSFGPSYDLYLKVKHAVGLNELYDDAHRIATGAADRLAGLLERLPGGSIGLAGPRGAGKTTLIREYCPDPLSAPTSGANLSFMVAAPVEYEARDFLYHLFAALCRTYLESRGRTTDLAPALLPATARLRLPFLRRRPDRRSAAGSRAASLADRASRHLAELRYLQTHTATLGAKATLGVAEPSWETATASVQQPLPYPETVAEFRLFLQAVGQEVHDGGGWTFVGIDELDKMSSAEQAYRFLNELKTIFGIPYCYFLVAVSEDALTEFEMRGLPIRTAFDSSFDEVIAIDYLPYDRSRELLCKRVIGMSEPFLALCHCLSGGLPRDLIRACRRVVGMRNTSQADIGRRLPKDDCGRDCRQGSGCEDDTRSSPARPGDKRVAQLGSIDRTGRARPSAGLGAVHSTARPVLTLAGHRRGLARRTQYRRRARGVPRLFLLLPHPRRLLRLQAG